MRSVSGNPRLGTIHDLLAQAVVLGSAARIRRKREDAFPVGGAFLEAHALADHGPEDLVAEHLPDLLADVPAERRPPVVHGDDDPENLQLRVGPLPYLLDGLE